MEQPRKKYSDAYDKRYKTAHTCGVSWSSDISTLIVTETLEKYHIGRHQPLLEIGCGEGRNSRVMRKQAADVLNWYTT